MKELIKERYMGPIMSMHRSNNSASFLRRNVLPPTSIINCSQSCHSSIRSSFNIAAAAKRSQGIPKINNSMCPKCQIEEEDDDGVTKKTDDHCCQQIESYNSLVQPRTIYNEIMSEAKKQSANPLT